MKTILALTILVIVGCAESFKAPHLKQFQGLNSKYGDALKKLSSQTSSGSRGTIFPPFQDPSIVNLLETIDYPMLNMTLKFNGNGRGLSTIKEDTRVRQSLFSITINTVADLETFTLDGMYSAHGMTTVDYGNGGTETASIRGDGQLRAVVHKAKIIASVYIWVDIFFGDLHIEDLAVDFLFDDVSFTAENFTIGEELIDWSEYPVKLYWDMFIWTSTIRPKVTEQVYADLRRFIWNKKLSDIVDIINNGKEGILFRV